MATAPPPPPSTSTRAKATTPHRSQSLSTVRILLTGASGYVGQHLLRTLAERAPPLAAGVGANDGDDDDDDPSVDQRYEITALYRSSEGFPRALREYLEKRCHPNVAVVAERCDLAEYGGSDGDDGGDSPPYDVCIHAAAMSSPRACQDDPARARALNCPEKFLRAVRDVSLLVVLSTDQVYDGRSAALYGEDDLAEATAPVNAYAESKVLLERRVRELRADDARLRTVVLRSSIVVGPRAPVCDDAHETFFHFCASRDGEPTDLWANEWRSIVSVSHVCETVAHFVCKRAVDSDYRGGFDVYNLGGPERVNRLDIGRAVFAHFGYDPSCLRPAEQTSPNVPLDISMDSSRLEAATGIEHRPPNLRAMVEYAFRDEGR